jgi:hypothetical protein
MNIVVRFVKNNFDTLPKKLIHFIYSTNQSNIPALGSLEGLVHVQELYACSKYLVFIKNESDYLGFAFVMDSKSDYQSVNYQYFKKKYKEFLYVDRVAVADKFQRIGVGSKIYKELYHLSSKALVPLCCEVNTFPLNQQSLDFHSKEKFNNIEEVNFGKKRVAMLVKYCNPLNI